MIRRNIETEARLIDDLLDITRISRGKLRLVMQDLDLHQTIRHVMDIVSGEAADKRLEIDLKLGAAAQLVHGDPARLQQVFWNLLKNAIKFTPEGGRISVTSRNKASPASEAAGAASKALLAVEISDTGIGIEPGVLPRIFDAFEQGEQSTARRFGGLGLGLTISRGLVEAHGGAIRAFSRGKDRVRHVHGRTAGQRRRRGRAADPGRAQAPGQWRAVAAAAG